MENPTASTRAHHQCFLHLQLCAERRANAAAGEPGGKLSVELRSQPRRSAMDWNRVEGNWKQVKGKVKEQWGRLTDDDLDVINGKQDQLEGRLQQRYGYAKDQAAKEVNDWYGRQKW
jgi:uncharacterized protein YjbJ (UPF0337 family)